VPADGTTAAAVENGDFGASPFFGQLWVKSLLAMSKYRVSALKHKAGREICFPSGRVRWASFKKASFYAPLCVLSRRIQVFAPRDQAGDVFSAEVRTQPGHCLSKGTWLRRLSKRPLNLWRMGAETFALRTQMAASTAIRNSTNFGRVRGRKHLGADGPHL
jgi:hypothetical protein